MQFKTTAVMAILFIGLLSWLLLDKPHIQGNEADAPSKVSPTGFSEQLFGNAPEVEEFQALVVKWAGKEPWRFERANDKTGSEAEWKMTTPIESSVPRYEIENAIRTVKDLNYQIKYASGSENAMSAEQAGLAPARVQISLIQKDGDELSVEVGKPAGANETYVRRTGEPDVIVARQNLERVVKKSVNDYRDKGLIKFTLSEAVGMKIVHRPADGEVVTYRLTKSDDDWRFEEPFNADADDRTITGAVTSAARLRAIEWAAAESADSLRRFGLDQPSLEVEITTRTEVDAPTEDDGDETDDGPLAKVTEVIETHAFALSERSPLGKDTSVYCRVLGSEAVAIVSKTVGAKFKPDLEKWRNMDVCPVNVKNATAISIKTSDGAAQLKKNDQGAWVFEDTGSIADRGEIVELLTTIDGLKALNFADGVDVRDPAFGLTAARATIELTLPGLDQPERFTLGNATDDVSKRVYYLRRGESTSIAKIRADEAAVLNRPPTAYLNREVLQLSSTSIKSVRIDRANLVSGEPESLTLARRETGWRMTSPVDAPTDTTTAVKLVATLANLTADKVAATSDDGSFGLSSPVVTITVTHAGTPIIKTEADDDQSDSAVEDVIVHLRIGEAKRNHYIVKNDAPTVYQLRPVDFDVMLAEFRNRNVFDFQQSQSVSVSVTNGAQSLKFDKKDEGWVFASEPDLPIDQAKVTNLIIQMQDLKLKRYVAYNIDDPGKFGLDTPRRIVTVATDENRTYQLLISSKTCEKDAENSLYAIIGGTKDVFLITTDSAARFDVTLDDIEKSADS